MPVRTMLVVAAVSRMPPPRDGVTPSANNTVTLTEAAGPRIRLTAAMAPSLGRMPLWEAPVVRSG